MTDNNSQLINNFTETSTSSPKRIRPTDRQMGLGTHDLIEEKMNEKNNKKQNT
jgi:hypothetical protein